VVGATLARIFLEYKLELTLFCQLYLIAATLACTILALFASDERESCLLQTKLPYFVRRGFKPGNGQGNPICPVMVELEVFVAVNVLPHAGHILKRDGGRWP
jgi:hypothetical protein